MTPEHCETCEGLGWVDVSGHEAAGGSCTGCDGHPTYAPDKSLEPIWDAACTKCDGTGEVDIINPDWMGAVAGDLAHSRCSCRTDRVIQFNAMCSLDCVRGRTGGRRGEMCLCASDFTMRDLSFYEPKAQVERLMARARAEQKAGDMVATRYALLKACEHMIDWLKGTPPETLAPVLNLFAAAAEAMATANESEVAA